MQDTTNTARRGPGRPPRPGSTNASGLIYIRNSPALRAALECYGREVGATVPGAAECLLWRQIEAMGLGKRP